MKYRVKFFARSYDLRLYRLSKALYKGLVWDGGKVNDSSGSLAHYMRFSVPHNASLFVSAYLPIIAPSGTAVDNDVFWRGIKNTVHSQNERSSRMNAVSAVAAMKADGVELKYLK